MSKSSKKGFDARTCKQANIRFFNESLNRVLKDLPKYDPAELFMTEFRGVRFNCLPFVLNGACYFDSVCYGWLMHLIAKEVPIQKDISLAEISKCRLFDSRLFNALMPGDHGRRESYALLLCHNQQLGIRLLYQCACRALNHAVIAHEMPHISYKCSGICNTQAFCYYMTIWWLVNITPVLRRQIEPNLKKLKFYELLERLCPEESIHFKYIKGELTVDQLLRSYDDACFEDGSSAMIREAYSNVCKGQYDGSPMTKEQWSIGREEADDAFQGSEPYLNMHVSHAYLYAGTYDKMSSEIERMKSMCAHSEDTAERARQRYNKSADECRRLRKQNKEFQEKISQLQREIVRQDSHDELHKRIDELESKLKEALAENDKLFDERLEMRQELSSRAKQIKKLSALVPEQDAQSEAQTEELTTVSIEDMIAELKNKRIVMVGGDRSKSLTHTFKEWGFRYFSNISGSVRRVDCDFLVVCSILCSHSDMYQAERMIRGQDAEMVYVGSTNAEIILRALYEALG